MFISIAKSEREIQNLRFEISRFDIQCAKLNIQNSKSKCKTAELKSRKANGETQRATDKWQNSNGKWKTIEICSRRGISQVPSSKSEIPRSAGMVRQMTDSRTFLRSLQSPALLGFVPH